MTLKEFQAWLDGFSESIKGSPNERQWKKIQKRISEIVPDKEVEVVPNYGTFSTATLDGADYGTVVKSTSYCIGKQEAEELANETKHSTKRYTPEDCEDSSGVCRGDWT